MSAYPTGTKKTLRYVLRELDMTLKTNTLEKMPTREWFIPGMFFKVSPCDDSAHILLAYSPKERDTEHHRYFNQQSGQMALRLMAEAKTTQTLKQFGVTKEMLEDAKKCYKIHLMLSIPQLASGLLQIFLMWVCNDIAGFKYKIPEKTEMDSENTDKVTNPTVVIYCRPDVMIATRVLNYTKLFFGELPRENVTVPRYNIHVGGVIFYASGDSVVKAYMIGDDDHHPHKDLNKVFDAECNYALYKGATPLVI